MHKAKNDKLKISTDDLIELMEALARGHADGHFTILKFTTGWKCMVGTQDLDNGCRNKIHDLKNYETFREALIAELRRISKEVALLKSLQTYYEKCMNDYSLPMKYRYVYSICKNEGARYLVFTVDICNCGSSAIC